MARHKHADLIHAWAEGAEIECWQWSSDKWLPLEEPQFHPESQYRIKPTPKPDVVIYYLFHKVAGGDFPKYNTAVLDSKFTVDGIPCNLRLTFDGETGQLKSAEVPK